jgi:hypothetical protein
VGFLERDFEHDHLAEKATGQKWAKKYTELCDAHHAERLVNPKVRATFFGF